MFYQLQTIEKRYSSKGLVSSQKAEKKKHLRSLLNKKAFLSLFLILNSLFLFGQGGIKNCDFHIQVTAQMARCYNDGYVTIKAVDGAGNELYIAAHSADANPYNDLSEIKYGYKKISSGADTVHWTNESTIQIDTGTYMITAQALCFDASQPEGSRYSIVEDFDTVTITTSYVKPKVSIIEQMAGTSTGYGTVPALVCDGVGRVQFRIYDGAFPYMIRICNADTVPIDTVYYADHQYNGTNTSRYDYNEYYSIDGLQAGKYFFFVEDGCEYHLPRVSQTITTVQDPSITAVSFYAWSGSYADSNRIRVQATLNLPNAYYNDPENVKYRFIHNDINGVTDTTDWKLLPNWSSYVTGDNNIVLYDTIHNAHGYCDLYGKTITFQALKKGCVETINLTKSHIWNKPTDFYTTQIFVSDSSHLFSAVYDSCGYYTSYDTSYGHYEPVIYFYNDNEYFYKSTDATTSVTGNNYQVTYPIYYVYRDTRNNSVIKIDTVRRPSQPTASWSSYSSNGSYPSSVLREADIEPIYGAITEVPLTIPVSRTLYDAFGCEIYTRTDDITYKNTLKVTSASRYNTTWATRTNQTYYDYCCNNKRSVTVYGDYVQVNYGDSTVVELIQSPLNNRYNFKAIYHLATNSWTYEKDSISNLADITFLGGTSVTIADYCLPSGVYKFRVTTPHCGTFTPSTTVTFNDTHTWTADLPTFNTRAECAQMWIKPTGGRYYRNVHNEYKSYRRNGVYYTGVYDSTETATARYRIIKNYRPSGSSTSFSNTYFYNGDSVRVTGEGDYVIEITQSSIDVSTSQCPSPVYYDTVHFDGGTVAFDYVYTYLCDSTDTNGWVHVKGKEGTLPYTYTLYSGPDLSGEVLGQNTTGRFDAVPLSANQVVSVHIKDACDASFQINQPVTVMKGLKKAWFFGESQNMSTCEGTSVDLFSVGLDELVTYHWTGPNGFEANVQNPRMFLPRGSAPGYYKVEIQNTSCEFASVTDSVYIDMIPAPTVTILKDTTVCPGEEVTVEFQPIGTGTIEYTIAYEENSLVHLQDYSGASSMTFEPTSKRTYWVYSVKDDNCNYTIPEDTVVININNHIATSCDVLTTSPEVCHNTNTEVMAHSSLATPYYIRWYKDYEQTQYLRTDTINNPSDYASYLFENVTQDTSIYVTVSNADYCESKYGTVMNWMNMSSGHKELRCGESIRFYDSGGKLNDYSAFEDATHVFTTLDGQPLTLTFTELNTQTTYDHLLIYTGNTTNPDSLIADLSGNYTGHLPEPIVSNGNSMTVRFLSNGKTEASGWVATVSNNPKPTAADVHVYDELSVASVSADPYVHYDGSVTIDAHAEGGKEEAYLYQWHTSTDGGTSWNFVSSETTGHDASITLHNLTEPTQVKVTVQDASTDPCTGAEDIVKFIPIANIKLSLDIEVADVDVCEQDYPVKVTVHNNGPQTAEQVTALVKLPYNVEFINPADSLLLVGDLAGHDSAVFNFMVRSYVIDNYEQHLPVKAQIWSCVQGDSVPTVEYGDWNWNGAPRQVDEDVDSLVTKPYLLPSDFSIAAIDDTVCYLNTAVLKASSNIAAPQYFKWFGDAALTHLLKTDTVNTVGGYTQYELDSLTTETTLYITIENDNYCPAVLAGAVNAKFNAASTRTVNMQDGSTPVGINDNISFYDDGGVSGNYLNKKDYTHTFTSTSGAVVLRLNNITLGTGEALTLYDGPTTSSPVLASYTASSTASSVYTANSGALTVRWHSDASGVDAGWNGNVVNSSSYISTEAVARLYSPVNKVNVSTGDDYVCYGDDATLTASTSIDAPQYFTWYDNEFSILKQDTSSTGTSTLNVPNQTRQNTYYVSVSNDLTCPAVVGHNSSQYTTGNTVLMNSANNNKTTKVKYGEPINFYDEGGPSGDYFTHNAVYTHTFSTERGNIKLVFTSFYSESTSYDWMYIYDGPNTSSPMMGGKLGGALTSQMPKTFTSTGNSLTVYWRTDVSVVSAGWAATVEALTSGYDTTGIVKDYNILLDASTNGNSTNISPDDVFAFYDDGGSTGAYSNNAGTFTHTFKATEGVVQADLSQLYLASGDTLFLYDGTTLTDEHLIAKLSGNITVARQYFSSGDKMTFKFMSHGNTSTTYYGWNMQVTSKWSEALAQANVYLHAPVADASLYGSVEEVCYNDDAVLKAYSDEATVFTWYAPDKATILKRDTITSSPSTLELSNVRSDAIYYISTNAVGSCPTIPPYQISTELLNIGNNGKSTHLDSYDYINFYDEGGSAANYYSNTYNYAHTYTTDEGQMHIRFNSLTLAALDTLCLYSGTTANSDSLIVALTNANNTSTAVNYHSTGNKLTVMFKKKSTTTAAGWSAAVTNHSTLSQTVILNALTDNKTTYVSPIDNIQFYDDGGLSNNYNLTNKTQTHTFTAMQGKVKVKFGTTGNQLNTNDNLIVIDGDADGTILATLSGAASNFNSKEFVSSGNQLTFQFVTSGKGVSSGWNVEVTALNDLPLAEAKVSIKAPSSKTNLTSTDDFVCYGETAVLTAKAPSLAYPQIYTWYTPTLSTVARDTVETVGGSELVLPNQTQDEYYLVSVQNGDVCPTMFPIGHTVVKTNPSTPTASTYVAENDIINFYDDGGPSSNYTNGQNDYVHTFTTATGKQVYVNFTQHTLATGDTLYIYDGATADNANLIERFSYYNNGTTGSYQSTLSALTFKFAKHSSINAEGWNASIATWQQTAKEIKLNAETDQQMSIVTPADSIMFYDDGYTSNYVTEKDTLVYTFKAFQGNVELKFNSMSLGSDDYLYLYSGDEVNAAHRIASLTSSTATYRDTSITVQFIKKGNYAGTGWVAKVVSKVVPVMDTAYVSIHRPLTGAVVSATNDTLCYGETAALTANSSIKYPQYYTWWNDDLSAVLKQDTVSSGNISHFNPENQISDSIYYVTIHNDTTCPYDPTGYPAFKTLKPNLLMNNTSSTAKVLVGNLDSIPFYDHGGINGNTSTTSQYYYLLQADPGQQVVLHIDTLYLNNSSTNALKVYDGISTSATLKADLYGAISDTTIVSTNGSLYLYQKSTSGVMGWEGIITSDYQPFAIAKSEVSIRKPLGSVAVTATNDTVCYDYTADLTATSSLTYPQYYTWWASDGTTLLSTDTINSAADKTHFRPEHQISDSLYYVHVYDSLNCPYLPEVYNFGENKFLGDFLMTPDKANKVTTLACGDSLNFYDEGGKTGSYTRHNQNYYHTFKAEEGKQVVLKLTSFYSESLSFDWMCIYDGTTPIARYRLDSLGGNLNASMPKTYVSTTGSLTVRWRTDNSQLYDGWEGTITIDCHGTDLAESHVSIQKPLGSEALTATNDTVCYDYTADLTATSSLTYPQYYTWWASDGTTLLSTDTINSAADKTHFRPEHQISDSLYYVHAYDSLNCAYIPSLHARILLPEYKMNQTSVDTTFLSCGDSIPFYDHGGKNGNTTTSSTYYRIFKAEPGKQVTIHIDTLSLISNSSYYLKIYDGVTETGTPLANLYGNKANLTYTSTKGALYVRHNSYPSYMGWEGSVTTNCFDLAESHVSIHPFIAPSSIANETCQSSTPYTYLGFKDIDVSAPGVYTIDSVFQSAVTGCDSAVTLTLTVNPVFNQSENQTICQNELPYDWRDTTFQTGTVTGDYVFNRQTVNGCDSIVTLHLTVNPSYYQNENLTICQNELPYTWRDTTFQTGTVTGDYVFNRQTVDGCDSIVTLHLTVNPSYDQTENLTICQNALPYDWRDTTFQAGTVTGDYVFNRLTVNGCDSSVTLHLTVTPSYDQSESLTICQNELPYTWRDTTFQTGTITGDYVFNRLTVNGCDSIVTLHLTVNPSYDQTENLTICQNELPYTWRDTTFQAGTVTGDYVFNRQTVDGCDSIVTLHLTVNPSYYQNENLTICQNELPYTWRDTTFQAGTVTGDYVFNRHTVNGCDSIVTLHLTVTPSYNQSENLTICQNELPYDWRDTTFQTGTVTGDYVFSRQTIDGCDSIVTLHLTVNPSYSQSEILTLCQNELPYTWRDTTFLAGTVTGNYVFNRHTVNGCDSIVTLHLTVNPSYSQSESLTLCQNELPYTWRDTTFQTGTVTGDYVFSRQTIDGCDSIVTLHLTVNPSYSQSEILTLCQNELPYTWRDTTFLAGTVTGNYVFNRHTVNGCDSIVTLHLTVNPSYSQSESLTICQNELPYTWRDTTFLAGTVTGDYVFNRLTVNGCDSIVTLHLTVNPSYSQNENLTICQNELPYTWRDTTFQTGTITGDYVFNRLTVNGCDSIVTLHLTVNPSYYQNENLTICQNELPYTWRDTTFQAGTVTGDYVFNRHTVNGCDSIVTLHLTVNPSYSQSESLTICQNELPYDWRDTTFQTGTVTGDYVFSRQTIDGCDSIVTLHLTVNPSYSQSESLTLCQNELPYTWRDTTFLAGTVTGDYVFNRLTVNGCDSIVTLHLTVNPSYSQNENLTICQNELPYTWRDTTFLAGTVTGDYVFNRLTVNGCDSTVTLHLTVNPSYDQSESLTICQNELPYDWRDTTFQTGTVTGDYVFSRLTVNGCDSTVTLHLTVNPSYSQSESLTLCQNELPYTWRDTTFLAGTVTGDYVFNRHTVNGCDSIVTLTLTVNPSYYQNETETVCQSELPYTWRDTTFQAGTVTGDYVFNRLTVNGCDSIVTLHLTIKPAALGMDDLSDYIRCNGAAFSVTPTGTTIPAGTQYVWTVAANANVTGQSAQTTPVDAPISQMLTNTSATKQTVVYTVTPMTDGCAGDAFTVTVEVEPTPELTLNCPADITKTLEFGSCALLLNPADLGTPSWAHSLGWSLVSITNDAPADNMYPEGDNVITWTMTDECGNTTTCEQHVIVIFPQCPDAVDYEGNVYHGVRIDCDCWTQRNLESHQYSDGSDIPGIYSYISDMYPDSAANAGTFGLLYDWESAIKDGQDNGYGHVQGICPEGWYLPTAEKYEALNLHGAAALKSPLYWLDGGGNNSTGFTSLPAGYYDGSIGRYLNLMGEAYYWSTTKVSGSWHSSASVIKHLCEEVSETDIREGLGYSVRCIKEKE